MIFKHNFIFLSGSNEFQQINITIIITIKFFLMLYLELFAGDDCSKTGVSKDWV